MAEEMKADVGGMWSKLNNNSSAIDLIFTTAEIVNENIKKSVKAFDDYTQLNTKLGLISGGDAQKQQDLQERISIAAQNTKSSYKDIVDTMVALNSTPDDLFKSNDESLDFTQLIQKSYAISGTPEETRSDISNQINSGMLTGSLSTDGLSAVADGAPLIFDAISQYTNKSSDELFQMAENGELTAEIIKNAMFSMGENIDTQFLNVPATFNGIIEKIKIAWIQGFGDIAIKINDFLSSTDFVNFINGIINIIYILGDVIDTALNVFIALWPVIKSILMAIGLIIFKNIITLLPTIIGYLGSIISKLFMQAIGWIASNWQILLIVGAIALVLFLLQKFGSELLGFIGGIIGFLVALFINGILAFLQMIISKIESFLNIFVVFGNFISNIFTDPIGSIINLFSDLADYALNTLEKIATAIDYIFGSNFAKTVKGWRVELESFTNEKVQKYGNGKYDKKVNEVDINKLLGDIGITFERADYSNSFDRGNDIGGKLGQKAEDFLSGRMFNIMGGKPGGEKYYSDPYSNIPTDETKWDNSLPVTVEGTGSGGSIPVEMPDEDLEYLREIAERDYIANVATNSLAPSIAIQFGDVHETADANKVAGRIKKILQEEIAMVSEGVY